MKLLLFIFIFSSHFVFSQTSPFRFAFISDTHIGSPDGRAEEDLRRTVADINMTPGIAFVVLTGDITELGSDKELRLARHLLDSLQIRYYIIPGNHDTGWSESGGVSFAKIFGYDRFVFDYNGIRFIGCASGPYVRMSDGHIPRDALIWIDSVLQKTPKNQPLIFLNHYPIDNGLDNWYEITDRLKKYHVLGIICGHGHRNTTLNFEGIPGVMGRSNLRARTPLGGYNIVDVRRDSIVFSEKKPGEKLLPAWASIPVKVHSYDTVRSIVRPSFQMNNIYSTIERKWMVGSDANVISTPCVAKNFVIFGNSIGRVDALSITNGKVKWSFNTNGAIYSSPASSGNNVVFGSADGNIYCLDRSSGKLKWKFPTSAAVLGSPVIDNGIVYIGGSDHEFRALDIQSGKEIWSYKGLNGPVVSTPLLYNNMVIFGAWDTYLHALDKSNGELLWKWSSGSSVINYSPASCIPVASDGVIYIAAPDRHTTAIDALNGQTLWRTNETGVRESIGISEDNRFIYGKAMNDTIVAYHAGRSKQPAAWKMHSGYGYDHVPSMLIEKEGTVFFGTRNGVVYAIDPKARKVIWSHKIDNSMVNTIRVVDKKRIIASTMDGKVVLLKVR